jgi:hypothetical protein
MDNRLLFILYGICLFHIVMLVFKSARRFLKSGLKPDQVIFLVVVLLQLITNGLIAPVGYIGFYATDRLLFPFTDFPLTLLLFLISTAIPILFYTGITHKSSDTPDHMKPSKRFMLVLTLFLIFNVISVFVFYPLPLPRIDKHWAVVTMQNMVGIVSTLAVLQTAIYIYRKHPWNLLKYRMLSYVVVLGATLASETAYGIYGLQVLFGDVQGLIVTNVMLLLVINSLFSLLLLTVPDSLLLMLMNLYQIRRYRKLDRLNHFITGELQIKPNPYLVAERLTLRHLFHPDDFTLTVYRIVISILDHYVYLGKDHPVYLQINELQMNQISYETLIEKLADIKIIS